MTEILPLAPVSAQTAPLGPGAAPQRPLDQAAKQMEAVFLRQMIAAMRQASLGDELFGSSATQQFRDMADARVADAMAGRFGIGAMLSRQLESK